MKKDELLSRVAELVGQVTAARFEGAQYSKLARAHGYADGYMRALLDAGLVDRDELLRLVGQARTAVIADLDAPQPAQHAAA
ncbi:MAG: hypothetical protein K8H88_21710 [Sandaracinaceae bacterium]|nr:hypothetical protein [Sandaracinaceae bacterium]